LLIIGVRNVAQQVPECGEAVAWLIGKIGPNEKRGLVLRGQEDRQRPASRSLSQQLMGRLIDLVQVRPLLPVHLDIDVELIHQLCGLRIIERLMGHHVTPVAGRVANGEQDRAPRTPGQGEGLLAPLVPVDRIVSVLQQVGAGCLCEMVFFHAGLVRG